MTVFLFTLQVVDNRVLPSVNFLISL